MPFEVTCPNCAQHKILPDDAQGKRFRCSCGQEFIVGSTTGDSRPSANDGARTTRRQSPVARQGTQGPHWGIGRGKTTGIARPVLGGAAARRKGRRLPTATWGPYIAPVAGVAVLLLVFLLGSKLSGGKQSSTTTGGPKADQIPQKNMSATPPSIPPSPKAPLPMAQKPYVPSRPESLNSKARKTESAKPPDPTVPSEADALDVARKAHEDRLKKKEMEKAQAEKAERDAALAIASSSLVASRVEKEAIQVPVGPAERVYFKGFETPTYSQEERVTRYNWLQTNYPYEDEAERRYKIVQKTEPKEVERTLTKVSFVNRGRRTLTGAIVVISSVPIAGAPESLPLESVSAIPIEPLGGGEDWAKEAQVRPGTTLKYFLVYPVADESRAYWIPLGEREAQAFPVSSEIAQTARRVCEAIANAAQSGQQTNWRQDKVTVATRFVQRLVKDGTLISARRQPDADSVADIAFEFTFRTEAGFTRARLGYVYVEPIMDGWTVRAVNIDGRRLPAND